MHKVETWNRASAAEVDGIACCIFSESAHTTSAREHTTRNVGVRPRMWTACIAHVFDMLTFVSHLPSSTFFPRCRKPSKYRGTGVSQIQLGCIFYNTCHAASRGVCIDRLVRSPAAQKHVSGPNCELGGPQNGNPCTLLRGRNRM